MSAILTSIGSLVTSAMTWATSVVTFITASGNELVLCFVAVSFVGLGVGLLKRIVRV